MGKHRPSKTSGKHSGRRRLMSKSSRTRAPQHLRKKRDNAHDAPHRSYPSGESKKQPQQLNLAVSRAIATKGDQS